MSSLLVLAPAQLQRFDTQAYSGARCDCDTVTMVAQRQTHHHQFGLSAALSTVFFRNSETEQPKIRHRLHSLFR